MPGRKYVSDFSVGIGPVNLNGALYGLRKTDNTNKFVSVCPDCETPVKPSQMYVCPVDASHMHPMAELDKAKELGGELIRVDAAEVSAARKSDLPLNVFRASVHPKAEVENVTWHADNSYVFIPKVVDEYYGLAVRMIEESDMALIAMTNVSNHEGFYRLVTWKGNIVLQKLHWPEECESFDTVSPECDDNVVEAAMSMLNKMVKPFDADVFKSGVKQNLQALEANLWGVDEVLSALQASVKPASKKPDLLGLLAAFDA